MCIQLEDERKVFHQSLKWLPPGETVIRFLESVMVLQDLQTYRGEVSWKFSIQLHQHTAPCTRNDKKQHKKIKDKSDKKGIAVDNSAKSPTFSTLEHDRISLQTFTASYGHGFLLKIAYFP